MNPIDDRRKREESLYNKIFKIRYPEYTNIKSNAESIINSFKANGLEIDFPEYFESDEIGIKVKIKKRENINTIRQKLDSIDPNKIQDLLNLL